MRGVFLKSALLAGLAAAAAGGWWFVNRPPAVVATAVAITGPAVQAVYATGTVEPVVWARIGPAVKGRIVAIEAEEGARVEPGAVLARLDSTVVAAQVRETEARAQFLREDVQRLRQLASRDIIARAALDRAESEAKAAEAIVDTYRRRLDDTVMRAPLGGVVLRRDGEIGEVVDTTNTVFTVGEPRPLRVTADVDEEDIPRVAAGQAVLMRADAFEGEVLRGTVAEITPAGDPKLKVYRVRIVLPDDTALRIGMTVEANIVVRETEDAVLVPDAALKDGAVWILEGDRVRRQEVTIGVRGTQRVEIRQGLRVGQRVVLNPPDGLVDGGIVRLPGGAAAR
ncbi:efflux RND transporter periplasmic adaptor subunit [Elioraea rosea]|uniref:efflux RND transporter periplasmic adaptor subunit n=1 Tax=Elioraea rosea TaxID=2492390 RepID=UPI001185C897|nr:efflux RND transporter periplasmic adaptor subunit [Elioraea rosea]